MPRPRTTSRRRDVPVEHREIPDARYRQRMREAFEAREAARGRPSVRCATDTQEPERRGPTRVDNALKDLISRGFSEETARAMAAGQAPTPYRYAGHSGWPPEF
jgi:hypothetical protein